jgi:hypothetical protein
MMKINQVSSPSSVTEAQTISFLDNRGHGKYGTYYVCRDSLSLFKVIEKIKAIPEIDFFNNNREHLVYGDSICPGLAINFAKKLKPERTYKIDSSYNLEDIMNLAQPVRGDFYEKASKFDFSVIFYWASFVGRINNNVFEIVDELKNNPRLKIQYLFVNVDFLESWGMKNSPQII